LWLLEGGRLASSLPRAMPWARSFCPFRACGGNYRKTLKIIYK